jgi:hypothetical protein
MLITTSKTKYKPKRLSGAQVKRLERDLEKVLAKYGGYPSVETDNGEQILIYTDLYAPEE